MPTIELTQEQADELQNLLLENVCRLSDYISLADPVEKVELQYLRHTLSEIHHLLEIA